jgi:hypothetical protein
MLNKWIVEKGDISVVRKLWQEARKRSFVQDRIDRNVNPAVLPPDFCREKFWYVMIGCLLTTQQRSGPGSRVSVFLREECANIQLCRLGRQQVRKTLLGRFRSAGIWRAAVIADQTSKNLERLEDEGGWGKIEREYNDLLVRRSRRPRAGDGAREREAAHLVDELLDGFGPKQSRNLWQWLGLTRYEIPLDSRIIRWLNENVLSGGCMKLTAPQLSDRYYYDHVLDGVQLLCEAADMLPCVFDATVFSLNDREWRPGELEDPPHLPRWRAPSTISGTDNGAASPTV